MAAGISGYAALAIFYSLLAATLLEAVLYLWRVKDPPLAVRFRLGILAIPPVAPLLLGLFGSQGPVETVRSQVSVFDLRNWLGQEFDPSSLGWILLLIVMAATTLLLVIIEVNGLLRYTLADRQKDLPLDSVPEELVQARASLVARGLNPPPILAVAQPEPVAWTEGLNLPRILSTTALVKLLDREELETVLAHEVAHIRGRHNWLSWLIFGLRLVSFYNPVALFTFHQISHDVERSCDSEAAAATGKPLALASALIKVHQVTARPNGGRQPGWSGLLARRAMRLENRGRRALVLDRVERLVHPGRPGSVSYPGLRLMLAFASVVALCYVVT